MIIRDKIIKHSNDKLSHSCLISATGQFIIPTNRVLGDSAYQRVLDQLNLSKQQKRQKQGKKKKTGIKSDGEHDRKLPPDVDGHRDGGNENGA